MCSGLAINEIWQKEITVQKKKSGKDDREKKKGTIKGLLLFGLCLEPAKVTDFFLYLSFKFL